MGKKSKLVGVGAGPFDLRNLPMTVGIEGYRLFQATVRYENGQLTSDELLIYVESFAVVLNWAFGNIYPPSFLLCDAHQQSLKADFSETMKVFSDAAAKARFIGLRRIGAVFHSILARVFDFAVESRFESEPRPLSEFITKKFIEAVEQKVEGFLAAVENIQENEARHRKGGNA